VKIGPAFFAIGPMSPNGCGRKDLRERTAPRNPYARPGPRVYGHGHLTIALGVGASTAVFSVVYAVLYRPLPYPDADRLVAVWQTRPVDPKSPREREPFQASHAFISDSILRSWQANARGFEDIGGYSWRRFSVLAGRDVERVEGVVASSSFLKVLGVRPLYGRLMRPEEDVAGQEGVVVLGHAFWKQRFAGDPNVIGRTVIVDGAPHVVIGVLPADTWWFSSVRPAPRYSRRWFTNTHRSIRSRSCLARSPVFAPA
jgi:hypothetical protein